MTLMYIDRHFKIDGNTISNIFGPAILGTSAADGEVSHNTITNHFRIPYARYRPGVRYNNIDLSSQPAIYFQAASRMNIHDNNIQ